VRALAALGKIEEINQLLDECLNLPPQSGWSPASVMRTSAHELRVHGYKEEALEIAERAISWYKAHKDQDYRSSLADTLYIAEKWEEAQAIYEALHEEFPNSVDNLGYLGTLAARMGNKEKALRISDKLENIKKPYLFGNNTYWMACIAALLGEKEKAMKLLRDSLGQGVRYTRLYADMDLEPLFDYPPFKELIEPKG
jgi:tetratricopeptide (TPR) repeat protein